MMHMQHALLPLAFPLKLPQHSCNMLPQQQQQQQWWHRQRLFGSSVQQQQQQQHRASFLLSVARCRADSAINYAACCPVPGPSPSPRPNLPASSPLRAASHHRSRVSDSLAFNLCPRVASGSCLPKKAHTPSWKAAAAAPHVGVQSVWSLQTSMCFAYPVNGLQAWGVCD